jgi:Cys-tRNA(Pro)/Cys-tRNA(Cys) deacylase
MKVLESRSIAYQIHTYPEKERDAEKIAGYLGIPADRVFKTLVAVREDKKPLLVMVPGNHQLDLKKLAKGVGEKKVKLATHVQAEKITGLQVGGISPLALLNRGFDIVLDRSATAHEAICISAGKKGVNIELDPKKLQLVTAAHNLDVKA